jgi:hypothetical protein
MELYIINIHMSNAQNMYQVKYDKEFVYFHGLNLFSFWDCNLCRITVYHVLENQLFYTYTHTQTYSIFIVSYC